MKLFTIEQYKEAFKKVDEDPRLDSEAKAKALNGIESSSSVFLLLEIRDLLKAINDKIPEVE